MAANKIVAMVLNRAVKHAEDTVLEDYKKKLFSSEDPFYYHDRHGKKRFKRYKKTRAGGLKQLCCCGSDDNEEDEGGIWKAPGVTSDHDNEILASVRRRAWHLDMSLWHWCSFRFGWSALIGLIPFIGDAIDCILAFSLVRKANDIDGSLPNALRARMVANIMIDFGIGLIPFLGDIADAVYKANTRNTWLLEQYLVTKYAKEREELEKAEKRGTGGQDNQPSGSVGGHQAGQQIPGKAPKSKWTGKGRAGDEEMGVVNHQPQPQLPPKARKNGRG